jgi:hypothetical protein
VTWVDVTGTTQQAVSNKGYLADNASLVTITLPVTSGGAVAVGAIIQVDGIGAGGWAITQDATQSIRINGIAGISGASTGVVRGSQYAAIELQYIGSNTFTVLNYTGNVGVLLPSGYVYQGGLTWMSEASTTAYNYSAAVALCAGLINDPAGNPMPGWRLPTEPELRALYSTYPGIWYQVGWAPGSLWSSTPAVAGGHYRIYMGDGSYYAYPDSTAMYVTCVR